MNESCTVCHASGRAFDIEDYHPGLAEVDDAEVSIDGVEIAVDNEAQTASMTVSFTAKDSEGNPIPNLGAASATQPTRFAYLRFALSKLEAEEEGDPPIWVSYTTGDRTPANLTDNGDGTYEYLFATNLYSLYDAETTHRLLLMVFGDVVPRAVNVTYDFVPEQLPGPFTFPVTRDVITTAACNSCHGRLGSTLGSASFHGGVRYTAESCTVCHTTTLGEGEAELAPMTHRIHAAMDLGELGDFTEVTYPQDLRNCTKCHAGPDGDIWMNEQDAETCFDSCHGVPEDAPVAFHSPTTGDCSTCHNGSIAEPLDVEEFHLTENATPNNPMVPEGLVNFQYEIKEVTVSPDNQPVVTFRILEQTPPGAFAPVTFNTFTEGGTVLLEGFTGSPSFLVAYALPQDGVTMPVDYNNLGRAAAQPASVSILNIWNGTQGTLTGPVAIRDEATQTDVPGYYTATIDGSSNAGRFPEDAGLRAVALQGYFTQTTEEGAIGRHTISVVEPVTGEAVVRREVVDPAKCGNCHEWFEAHGGNRVYETQVCVVCHVPNLSTSGRGANPANLSQADRDALVAAGYDPDNPLTYPEATNNFKEMIHGIHASAVRTSDYEFVRDRGASGVFYYDWAEVTFPGIPSNCETCHIPGTYDATLPDGVLVTTDRTTGVADGQDASTADVRAARASLPNPTDWVNAPTASACYFCHDSNAAAAHFSQMGGPIAVNRVDAVGD